MAKMHGMKKIGKLGLKYSLSWLLPYYCFFNCWCTVQPTRMQSSIIQFWSTRDRLSGRLRQSLVAGAIRAHLTSATTRDETSLKLERIASLSQWCFIHSWILNLKAAAVHPSRPNHSWFDRTTTHISSISWSPDDTWNLMEQYCIMFGTNLSHTKATSLSGTSAARWLEWKWWCHRTPGHTNTMSPQFPSASWVQHDQRYRCLSGAVI